MQTTLQDLRYAIRMLGRARGFTVVALLTLALGIGANTAIFTVVNALLLRPLPYGEPDRLVMVWQDWRARGGPQDEWASPGNFADWRGATHIFSDVAAIGGWRPTLTGGTEPEPIPGEQVAHEYFRILGATPALGRDFRTEDDVPNAPRVAILGDSLWKRRFGADPGIVGRTVTLSGEPHQIIGVLPEGVRPIVNAQAEIWRPLRLNTATPSRGSVVLRVIGMLAPGLTPERAQVAASALAAQLRVQYPEHNEKVDFYVQPLHDRVVGDIRPGLLALLGAVAFVLLIACVNIANLLLARGSSRGRELAVRAALGAARGRVVRQLLTESLLLAVIGGICGVLIGVWAVEGLVALAPASAPRVGEIGLDYQVVAFAAGLTVITGLLFGLVPAVQAARPNATGSLKDGARGSSAAAGRGLRRALIAAEVALALVLLTGGGLLLQTFVKLQSADLGFHPDNVLVGSISLPRTSYPDVEKQRVFLQQVLDRSAALPGVEHAALTSILPFGGDSDMNFQIEGRAEPASNAQQPVTWYRQISAGYFDAMGMSIVKGKAIADREPLPSVVVNQTFARRFFPGEEPIGRRIRWRLDSPWYTIVGVAGDMRGKGARADTIAEMYVPYWQYAELGGSGIVLKTRSNPNALVGPLKGIVSSLDPNVPVANISLLSDLVADSIDQPRFFAVLAGGFALLALVLAGVGIYGVMAYVVSQRTTEIGVRMALGATPSEVFRLVLGDGLKITAVGIVLGVAGSVFVARALTSLLYGVNATDPVTLAVTAAILLTVAAAACFIPARRATRVDPMVALRAE
jgi:putative ABC transport system permease protein